MLSFFFDSLHILNTQDKNPGSATARDEVPPIAREGHSGQVSCPRQGTLH
jgi:hypothetical protein